RRLAHEPGDQDARLLAARQMPDEHLELLGPEQEALGPRGDVHAASLPRDGVALGSERAAQALRRVERRALLLEADDPQTVRLLDRARVRRRDPGEHLEERGLAAAV